MIRGVPSRRPTPATTAGRSGSSPASSTRGTTPTPRPPTAGRAAPGRSPSSSPSTRPVRRPTPDGRPWSSLTADERAAIIDPQRLAYVAEAPVNWCPGLGTVVANEEVTADGRSDRGNFPVFKRTMRQWMMRITAYADRLLDDLDRLDWTDALKTMQRNWIGRSTGARIDFDSPAGPISVFTTRPDTLFGATFMVLAPEHPLVPDLTTSAAGGRGRRVPQGRRRPPRRPSGSTRSAPSPGVFTGSYATNPATGDDIPIWIADYVLMGYGTGAIMAVPCGDQRDFEFATIYGLDIPAIQRPPDEWFAAHRLKPTLDTRYWPEAFVGDAPVRQLVQPRGVARRHHVGRRGHRHDQRVAGVHRRRRGDDHLQAARLAVRPAALLGRADPDRLRRRRQPARCCPTRCCP